MVNWKSGTTVHTVGIRLEESMFTACDVGGLELCSHRTEHKGRLFLFSTDRDNLELYIFYIVDSELFGLFENFKESKPILVIVVIRYENLHNHINVNTLTTRV